ncbi:MAG: hypothetical protein EHM42_05435 [Planctomycetaceae bacterium]|nr:MAG: hypothetical protein EHM42_05435 [Planctomycetaceae bacterium]
MSAQGSLDELLRVIPDDANLLMVVRVAEILKTPKAVREGWVKKQEEAYLAGSEAIPPWLSEIVRATHLHLEDSTSTWSVAAARTTVPASLQRIAEHHSAPIETIGKTQVVKTARNSYVTILGPNLVASVFPAYRQHAARWLQFAATNMQPRLSDYLTSAVTKNTSPHVLIAMDTQYMLDPQSLRGWLSTTRTLQGKAGQAESVAHVFDNLRGLTLAATIGDETTATLTLDFGVPVGANGQMIKSTLLEYLEDSGAEFEDLQHAQVAARDKTVTLTAPLTDMGLRQIFSMVVTPNPHAPSMGATTPPEPAEEVDAKRTRIANEQYYTAVDTLIEDLSKRNARATNYERTAAWHDSYATKIDNLSLKGIDTDLADYARTVSQRLRALAASLRGVSLKISAAQGELVVDYSVNPGQVGGWGPGMGYGGWGAAMYTPPSWRATSNLQQVREKQAQSIEAGADQREQLWQAIAADRQEIRKKMLDKFGEDFAQPR